MNQENKRWWLRPSIHRIFLLLAAVWLVLAAVPTSFAQTTLTLAEYRQLITDSHAIVTDLESLAPQAQSSILLRLADRWAGVAAVNLANNQQLTVSHSFILEQLRTQPANVPALQGLFAEMGAAVDGWPEGHHNSGDLNLLAEILARSEFDWPASEPSLYERLRDWLFAQLFDFLEWLFGRGDLPQVAWVNWLLTLVGFLLLVAVIAYFVRGLRASFTGEVNLGVGSSLAPEAISADEALRRAQTLSQKGDQRSAIRYLYLSALLLLEERGLLRHDRSQTNREYLRSVAHRPDLAAILQEVVEVFDRVWYGFQPIDAATVGHYTERVAELRRLPAARPQPQTIRRSDEVV